MKNYFNINVILLLLSNPVIAQISLPEISDEIRNLASKSVKSSAREKAFNLQRPVVSEKLKNKVRKLADQTVKNANTQRANVNQLLSQTVHNKDWKANQTKLIKQLKINLDIDKQKLQRISGHRLYLFVSSSIPKNKMRTYARQLSKYPNAQMLLRGFIGGGKKMQPTMAYIKSIIVKNENCNIGTLCKTIKTKVNIDPVLFQRYNITKVPTLVYVDELSGGNYCSEGNMDVVSASGVHKFIGLAPLEYMLSELSDKAKLSKLKSLLELR